MQKRNMELEPDPIFTLCSEIETRLRKKRRNGDQLANEFLLFIAPRLAEYQRYYEHENSQEALRQLLLEDVGEYAKSHKEIKGQLTKHLPCSRSQHIAEQQFEANHQRLCACEFCGSPNTVMDLYHDAVLVCSQCGIETPYRMRLYMEDLGYTIKMDNYKRHKGRYNPVGNLNKWIRELTAEHSCVVPRELFPLIRKDMLTFGLHAESMATPTTVLASLQRLKKQGWCVQEFYKCRWSIAKTLNKQYEPIFISEDTFDRIECIFKVFYRRYEEKFRKRNIHRIYFFNYNIFIHQTLIFLNEFDLATYIPLLKNDNRTRLQIELIWEIFDDLRGN